MCKMHNKINNNLAMRVLKDLLKKLKYKWPQFIMNLKRNADKHNVNEIKLSEFKKILKNIYKV